jgi:hypothetical protein
MPDTVAMLKLMRSELMKELGKNDSDGTHP